VPDPAGMLIFTVVELPAALLAAAEDMEEKALLAWLVIDEEVEGFDAR
jgi:hypothetical protein